MSNDNSNSNKVYYSKNHENHSFFSVDPFSLKDTSKNNDRITELSCNSSADIEILSSSSSSCTTSDHSDWKSSKRESYDSSMMTCTTSSTSAEMKELLDGSDVNSDLEYVTPTMSISPTSTTSTSSSITSTTKTIVASKKPVHGGKKSKDEKRNDFSIDNIVNGTDTRTTFMIRNIPNKYTQVRTS